MILNCFTFCCIYMYTCAQSFNTVYQNLPFLKFLPEMWICLIYKNIESICQCVCVFVCVRARAN